MAATDGSRDRGAFHLLIIGSTPHQKRGIHETTKEDTMTSSIKLLWGAIALALVLVGAGLVVPGIATTESPSVSLPVETVADYVHAVIEADRTFYTVHVVERLQSKGVVVASENWEQKNTLPLPAQFLMESGRLIAKKGSGVQYRLISLWPINKKNAAASEFEKTGLGTILTHPTARTPDSSKMVEGVGLFRPFMPTSLSPRRVLGAITHIRTARGEILNSMT
jgi:hypothetical protein